AGVSASASAAGTASTLDWTGRARARASAPSSPAIHACISSSATPSERSDFVLRSSDVVCKLQQLIRRPPQHSLVVRLGVTKRCLPSPREPTAVSCSQNFRVLVL